MDNFLTSFRDAIRRFIRFGKLMCDRLCREDRTRRELSIAQIEERKGISILAQETLVLDSVTTHPFENLGQDLSWSVCGLPIRLCDRFRKCPRNVAPNSFLEFRAVMF